MSRFPYLIFVSLLTINLTIALLFGWSHPVISYNSSESGLLSLLTTHFSHSGLQHLLANMTALMILLILFKTNIRASLTAFTVTIFAVAIYADLNHIESFQGSSALLYCIPGCYVGRIYRDDLFEALAVVIIFLGYLMINEYGHFTSPSVMSFTAAHLIGFTAGILSEWHQKQFFKKPTI